MEPTKKTELQLAQGRVYDAFTLKQLQQIPKFKGQKITRKEKFMPLIKQMNNDELASIMLYVKKLNIEPKKGFEIMANEAKKTVTKAQAEQNLEQFNQSESEESKRSQKSEKKGKGKDFYTFSEGRSEKAQSEGQKSTQKSEFERRDPREIEMVKGLVRLDMELKTNVFPMTQILVRQDKVPDKAISKQFAQEVATLRNQGRADSNPKRLLQSKVLLKKYVQKMAGKDVKKPPMTPKEEKKFNLEIGAASEKLKYQEIFEKINQKKLAGVSDDDPQLMDLVKQGNVVVNNLKVLYEDAIEEDILSDDNSGFGGPIFQNQIPTGGKFQSSAANEVPKAPPTKQELVKSIQTKMSYLLKYGLVSKGVAEKMSALNKKYFTQIGIAVEKAKTAQMNIEEEKAAPGGFGGDGANSAQNQSRNDQQVMGQRVVDLNEAINDEFLNAYVDDVAKSENLDGVQSEYFKNQVSNSKLIFENLFEDPSLGRPRSKSQSLEAGRKIIGSLNGSALSSQDQSRPIPDDPRKVVLLGNWDQIWNQKYGGLPSAEQPPISKKTQKFTLQNYLDYVKNVAQDVSKIQGDLSLDEPLSTYKNKTSVFTPKIQNFETNEFKITAGSAFKVRSCC